MKRGELEKMVLAGGYDGISDFVKRSGVKVSFETARRAMSEDKYSTWTLFLILRALGKSKAELKEILKAEGDDSIAPIIGDSEISDGDTLLLELIQKIVEYDPSLKGCIVSFLELTCKAAGYDATDDICALKAYFGVRG